MTNQIQIRRTTGYQVDEKARTVAKEMPSVRSACENATSSAPVKMHEWVNTKVSKRKIFFHQ